jgi:hypothetical protein
MLNLYIPEYGYIRNHSCDKPRYLPCKTLFSDMHKIQPLTGALRYKPEVRGFDFRWCHWIFSLI